MSIDSVTKPSPWTWFRHFERRSRLAYESKETELGAAGSRYRTRSLIWNPDETKYNSAEWTEVLRVFLSRFATWYGYVQEWEWKNVDCAWFLTRSLAPSVLIELENDSSSICKKKKRNNQIGEVPKLRRKLVRSGKGALGVLITYRSSVKNRDDIVERVERELDGAKWLRRRFLLILGESDAWRRPLRWDGLFWNGERLQLIE